MSALRSIELLAPARDLETARAAIQHGADAIYIGAPRFGARAAAGVSLQDLRQLCQEAHIYGVRIYVALNTILYDDELEEVRQLIWDIYEAGADALIIQDMGITMMDLPPIPLHSSTQCDTVEPEDAQQLEALGFEQIVLARELNIEQIRRIREVTTKPLEVFVHGALCVSYSGRCYISQAFTGRSANRGACSQQCRLPYNLLDSRGKLIEEGKHLLSPKDLNRSQLLEQLLEVGVSSFKIEGRLKGISYVKNITAYYRKCLDAIIARYPEKYKRASLGRSTLKFEPNPIKSFNRGFTDYQMCLPSKHQSKPALLNPHTPKSQGEYIGTIKYSDKKTWQIKTNTRLANGDGLLYLTPDGEVGGINVNVSMGQGRITTARPTQIPIGSQVFRNHDKEWERLLSNPTAERRLPIQIKLSATAERLTLQMTMCDAPSIVAQASCELSLELAKCFDAERLSGELSKLGDTIFVAEQVELFLGGEQYFVPLSILSSLRRQATERLMQLWQGYIQPCRSPLSSKMKDLDRSQLPSRAKFTPDYRANIANRLAAAHYRAMGYVEQEQAFELQGQAGAYLMTTKHCIKHDLGYCPRQTKAVMPYSEPLFLEQGGRRIRLEFDCQQCQMYLLQD